MSIADRALIIGVALCTLVVGGCVTRPEPGPDVSERTGIFRPVAWREVGPVIDDGDFESYRAALQRSLEWVRRQPDDRELSFGSARLPVRRLETSLARMAELAADSPDTAEYLRHLRREFLPWKVSSPDRDALLVTGYYVAEIEASLTPAPGYSVPIYGVPSDLVTVPLGMFDPSLEGRTIRGRVVGNRLLLYHTRQEIRAENALGDRAPVVAWARSEWDVFVAEVQGSAMLSLQDGSRRMLGYAAQNGHAYRAVGRLLLDEARIDADRMSMQAIGKYLERYPQELRRVLDYNPSFVFFRIDDQPALGSLGFPVTAERSVAVDMRVLPAAAAGVLVTQVPRLEADGRVGSAGTLARLVLNQDTGGAIRGPGRIDFFWGAGASAAERAGLMQHEGKYYLLLLKE